MSHACSLHERSGLRSVFVVCRGCKYNEVRAVLFKIGFSFALVVILAPRKSSSMKMTIN